MLQLYLFYVISQPKLLSVNLSISIPMISDDGDRQRSQEVIKCLYNFIAHFNWLNFTSYISDDIKRYICTCGQRQ
jgi:hypothetical protein